MTGADVSTAQVMISDGRPAQPPAVPDAPSLHPGVSGDGCVVAYSVPAAANRSVGSSRSIAVAHPRALRRGHCHRGRFRSALSSASPPPALSIDGSVIAVVDRRRCGALRRSGQPASTGPEPRRSSSTVVAPSATVVAGRWSTSALMGPRSCSPPVLARAPLPPPSNMFRVDGGSHRNPGNGHSGFHRRPGGSPADGSSTAPSISADGRIVTYQSDSTDLAAAGAPTGPLATLSCCRPRQHADVACASKVRRNRSCRPRDLDRRYDTSTDVHLLVPRERPRLSPWPACHCRRPLDGTTPTGPSVSGPVLSANGGRGGVRQHARRRAGR